MDSNENKPIYIHSFHFDTGTRQITIIASVERETRPETIILKLDSLPETHRRAFMGMINSVIPQGLRDLGVWSPPPIETERST